ncbi:hypothetical protein K402DRAFT_416197 [Aulographum hederae CBS 113979]|uniref:histidine kinase n=1 Tax=Aulographum hederae CBS 113979 TaxID=1176131 RepID=A0A6G1HHJ9_9PEZI|nr:hypothetical protein K402DRAFT_416197 [Aulographum hederae CBS 113979]
MLRSFDWIADPPPPNLTPYQKHVRDVDWENSPLGPMSQWPAQLKLMVLLIMADPEPAVVMWGDENTFIYNEAYTPVLGDLHPSAQGKPGLEIFGPSTWAQVHSFVNGIRETGNAFITPRLSVPLKRYGFMEDTYFGFRYNPIFAEDGTIVGIHALVKEITKEVWLERRLETTRLIANNVNEAKTTEQLWSGLLSGIESNPKDIPFALLYTVHDGDPDAAEALTGDTRNKMRALLSSTTGIDESKAFMPKQIDMDISSRFGARIQGALLGHTSPVLRVDDQYFPQEFLEAIDAAKTNGSYDGFFVCPLKSKLERVVAFVLLGTNPAVPLDLECKAFFRTIGDTMLAPNAQALLITEEMRRNATDKDKLAQQLLLRTEQFKRSQRRFTQFADHAAIGMAIMDVGGRMIFVNGTWAHICSQPTDSVIAAPWTDSFVADDQPLLREVWNRVQAENKPVQFKARLGRPSASTKEEKTKPPWQSLVRSALCTLYPEYNDDEATQTIVCCVTDVSELTWTESQLLMKTKELQSSEQRWKRFLEHAPAGVAILEASTLYLEYANPAWFSLTGLPNTILGSLDWTHVIHPDDLELTENTVQKSIHSNDSVTIEARIVDKCALEEPRGNQSQLEASHHLLCTVFPEADEKGNLTVICWLTDITTQKEAEDVLRRKMENAISMKRDLESFIDMTSHEMRNPLGSIIQCSDDITSSLQEFRAKELRVETLSSVIAEFLDSVLDSSQTITLCSNHQKSIIDDILTMSKINSNLIALAPTPTELKPLIWRAFRMFAAEFKAHSIAGYLDIGDSINTHQVDWAIVDASRILQVLINLLTNAIKFTKTEATRKVTLEFEVTDDNPSEFLKRKNQLKLIPNPNQEEQTSTKLQGDDIVFLHFAVSDSGCGIDEEGMGRLFQRFSQASPRTYSKYGGSGLGLYISRKLVELQGGEIGVASQVGKGSTFAFYVEARRTTPEVEARANSLLPPPINTRSPSPRPSPRTSPPTSPAPAPALVAMPVTITDPVGKTLPAQPGTYHILLVEDNVVNQKVMKKSLSKRGHDVTVANHGVEALHHIAKTNWYSGSESEGLPLHVVLMDVEMPTMNGLECTRQIRQHQREGLIKGHLPIIAVSANARGEQIDMADEAGVDDSVPKPFKIDDVMRRIEGVLDRLSTAEAKPSSTTNPSPDPIENSY